MELFWLADQEWLGPVGIIKTTWKSIRSRTRASLTFTLFATISTIALITPVFMTQAYKVDNRLIWRREKEMFVPDDISSGVLEGIRGTQGQLTMGLQSWKTDRNVATNMNVSTFYFPRSGRKAYPEDTFLAGRAKFTNATLPNLYGIRLRASCSAISSMDLDIGSLNTSWPAFCRSHIPQFHGHPPARRTGGARNASTLYLCNNQTNATYPFTAGDQSESRNIGYLYYNYTAFGKDETHGTSGLIQCNSSLTVGSATAHGFDLTYTDFAPQSISYRPAKNATGGLEIDYALDPLYAAFDSLSRPEVDLDLEDQLFRRPWTHPLGVDQEFSDYVAESVVDNLHNTFIIFTSAMARLGVAGSIRTADVPVNVTLYTRRNPYAAFAYMLLAAWAFLVGALTGWSYRRTFSNTLNSYVAAELIFRERYLLEGVPIGEVNDNEMLKATRFVFPEGSSSRDVSLGKTDKFKESKFVSQDKL
ncbi:hypothetical protein V5O48_007676 [Marasmius crinis-equi]|uniref:Uncharacterized protein n=1 Tax=Marasmius crinis-equi TaxID=585013 RepID=A0ABR3FG37_9AGAR